MQCGELMQSPVRWVQLRDTARTAARIMRDENVGFVIVCDRSGRVVGTVTDRDLALRLIADDHVPGATVESVMTGGPICCAPEDDVRVAETLMRRHHKSRIVCADRGGHAVGVISLTDIAHAEEPERVGKLLRAITNRETHA
jgi:CBS domain-containing protein